MRLSHHLASRPARKQHRSALAMLSGFFPVVMFVLFSNISQDLALWAGFASAFAVLIRDFAHERRLRLLDAGSTILFGLLALYAGFIQPGITIEMTRLVVDAGFLVLAFASIALRNPLTVQYAREQIAEEFWRTRRFVISNYGLTAFWMFAFAAMTAMDALSNIHKNLPPSFDAAICLVLIVLAVGLTARYPAYLYAHEAVTRRRSIGAVGRGEIPSGLQP